MRSDNIEFSEKNKSKHQEPIYVVQISFDLANTDTHFITSKTVSGLTGSISNKSLKLISSSTQRLDPDKAHATIGTIKFEALDSGLTELMREKLNEDKGLRNKRVRIYKGHKGLNWDRFTLFNTYVISNDISYKDGVYTFNCGDIQRSMKKKIFIETTTAIMSSVSATDSTIDVLDASKFELVYQVPSATGATLLRGLQQRVYPIGHENSGQLVHPQLAGVDHIGLIRIPGDNKDEIALFTGKTGNTLTGLIRGVLGTKAVDVEVDSGITIDDAPQLSEYVYMNMPAVKAIYALLTGSIYGAPGEFLPDHWHLGISTDYIKTSSFINIGSDLWDLSNDDKGFPAFIKGKKDVDAKKFIEEKLYYMLGLYAPINSNGEITLKRMQYIGPKGAYVRTLNESNIIDYSPIKYGLSAIRNAYLIKWNYDDIKEKYGRISPIIDNKSRERHQDTDLKIIEMDTLHGSRHSDASIKYHSESLLSRYSGPPLERDLTLTPDQDDLEVGDIVRKYLIGDEDHTNDAEAKGRNYEIQQTSIDIRTGRVKVSIFGSSQRASDVVPENPITASNVFLTSEGTEINAANFPNAGIVSSGGVTTVNGTLTLEGHFDLTNPDSVYYCTEALTIDASATVITKKNVQLRANGFFQHNGAIDGKGRGFAGGVADTVVANVQEPIAANLGILGVGTTAAQGGMHAYDQSFSRPLRIASTTQSYEKRVLRGDRESINSLFLTLDENGNLDGLPTNLAGTSGSSGGGIYNSDDNTIIAKGGDGGNSGAGLIIFSKGSALGDAATIDLSGEDGTQGELYTYTDNPVLDSDGYVDPFPMSYAGAGAGGAPGALVICSLDSSQTFFSPNESAVKLNHGKAPEQGHLGNRISIKYSLGNGLLTPFYSYKTDKGSRKGDFPKSSGIGGGGLLKERENLWESNTKTVFLDTSATPVIDPPPYVEPIPTFTLTEQLNTPVTPNGDRSSIEVSVTPPVFGSGEINNYSYSLVEYRVQGDDIWIAAQPASNETVIEVPTNGATYEVRIRAVSTKKLANDTGPIQTITVTNVFGVTDASLAIVYPFSSLNLVVDNVDGSKFKYGTARLIWGHSNSELSYFNHYEITVSHATDGDLRTEIAAASNYEYSLAKNREDYSSKNGNEGICDEVTFYVRAVSKIKNDLGLLYKGASESVTVDRVPPPDVSSLWVADNFLRWTLENAPKDLAGFEIRTALSASDTWESSVPITGGIITTTSYYIGTAPTSGTVFYIKAIDLSGNYSSTALSYEVGSSSSGAFLMEMDFSSSGNGEYGGVYVIGAGSVTTSVPSDVANIITIRQRYSDSARTTFLDTEIRLVEKEVGSLTANTIDTLEIDGVDQGALSSSFIDNTQFGKFATFRFANPAVTPPKWVNGTTYNIEISGP